MQAPRLHLDASFGVRRLASSATRPKSRGAIGLYRDLNHGCGIVA